jgi:hypothetical protein
VPRSASWRANFIPPLLLDRVCTATVPFLKSAFYPNPGSLLSRLCASRLFGDVRPVRQAALPTWHGLRGAAEKHE